MILFFVVLIGLIYIFRGKILSMIYGVTGTSSDESDDSDQRSRSISRSKLVYVILFLMILFLIISLYLQRIYFYDLDPSIISSGVSLLLGIIAWSVALYLDHKQRNNTLAIIFTWLFLLISFICLLSVMWTQNTAVASFRITEY